MKKIFLRIFLCIIIFPILATAQTGCVVKPFTDGFNKVFNTPVSAGSTQYEIGDNKNFVLWEGVCGPHTYLAVTSGPGGPCTLQGSSASGLIYTINPTTFPYPCPVPLDASIWLIIIVSAPLGYYAIKRKLIA